MQLHLWGHSIDLWTVKPKPGPQKWIVRTLNAHRDATLPPHPYLLLRYSPKHQSDAADRDVASEIVGPVLFFSLLAVSVTVSVCFFSLLCFKTLSCLRSAWRTNQKCSDLHRRWSGSPLFGLKLSRSLSYFKAPPLSLALCFLYLSVGTQSHWSLAHQLSCTQIPPRSTPETYIASLPCSSCLQKSTPAMLRENKTSAWNEFRLKCLKYHPEPFERCVWIVWGKKKI